MSPEAHTEAPTVATPWYALWTRSRHEKVVRARLDELGIEAFLPMVVRWNRWKDRTKQIEFPLFPGYCFARFDVREAKPVLGCTGVVAIVGTPGAPSAISENEIDAVRRLLDTGLSCDPCPFIKEGMPVVCPSPRAAQGRPRTTGVQGSARLADDLDRADWTRGERQDPRGRRARGLTAFLRRPTDNCDGVASGFRLRQGSGLR